MSAPPPAGVPPSPATGPGASPKATADRPPATPAATLPAPGAPALTRSNLLADPPPFQAPSLRVVLGFLVFAVLVSGVVYPLVIDGVERGVGSFTPSGAYVAGGDPAQLPYGILGENITNESLFWLRPSLLDYNVTLGSGEAPYGPTDPNLVNLTRYYIAVYGLNNTTAPLDLVGNSESGVDPDLSPAAALVQVPRVAAHTNLTQAFLTQLVQAHVTQPILGIFGPQYVNVITLDLALLEVLGSP